MRGEVSLKHQGDFHVMKSVYQQDEDMSFFLSRKVIHDTESSALSHSVESTNVKGANERATSSKVTKSAKTQI